MKRRVPSSAVWPRRGSITVEAALLFPLVLTLTFGLVEYGWMFLKHQQLTNAARQAARLAVTVDATSAQVTSKVSTLMSDYGLGSSGYTTTIAPANVATVPRGQQVSVTVSIAYGNIDITGFTLLPMPNTISAKVSMAKEGPETVQTEREDVMKWAIIGLCLLGSIAAACAALLVNTLRAQAAGTQMAGPAGASGEVSVLYATQSLPAMTVIESGAVVPRMVRRDQAPLNYLSNPTEVVGKVLAKPVIEGQAFTQSSFNDTGGAQQVAAVIPAGKRAVGISVSNYAGLEGLLYPGSVVDVMVSVKLSEAMDGARRDAFTATLLENIQVLAIERQTVVSPEKVVVPGEAAPRSNDTHTVTLLVDSKQAKSLQLAMEQGTLSLALRNPLDSSSADKEAISLQTLLGQHMRTAARAVEAAQAGAKAPTTQPVGPPQWETTVMRAGSVQTQTFPMPDDGARQATK